MSAIFRRRVNSGLAVLVLSLAGASAWVLLAGRAERPRSSLASAVVALRPAGYPQLVSFEPLPGGNSTLTAIAVQQRLAGAGATTASTDASVAADADRAPLRVLRDTYPTYSGIAVNTNTNEVFLNDENLFGIKVFNRLDNTPSQGAFTEPKRVTEGRHTKLEFNCGMYIDPQTGDVYSVANDVVDTLVIFPRDSKGNVAPKREILTPHATYGIAVDEEHQELFLTLETDSAVVVYRKMASGDEKPLRTLEGPHTRLEGPHGIAVDPQNNWLFVSNYGNAKDPRSPASEKFGTPSITVYSLQANADAPPVRAIEGPKTQMDWPSALFVAPERGELYVANAVTNSILVFHESDSGDAAPARIIKGPKTNLKIPSGLFLDAKNQELWVSNIGNHSATVYPLAANGDVAPLRTIRSAPVNAPGMAIVNPGGVDYDTKREQILVPS